MTSRKKILLILMSIAIVLSLIPVLAFTSNSKPVPEEADMFDRAHIAYRGSFDTWYLVNGSYNINAKILLSQWKLGFTAGGRAGIYATYVELNVYEEVPGTYDDFVILMLADYWEPYGSGYYLEGTTYWWKNGVLTYEFYAEIVIDPEYYEAQIIISYIRDTPNFLQIQGSLMPS